MEAKFSQDDHRRLLGAITWSDKKLRSFLAHRFRRMEQIVGHRYGEPGREKIPLPLLGMAVSIYARQLVSATPQTLVTTPHRKLAPAAYDLQLTINHLLDHEMSTVETLQLVAFDALISFGVAKVGLNFGTNSELEQGATHDPGQCFFDHILPDDFVLDLAAKRWDQITYAGDRFSAALESVLDNPEYDQKARTALRERKQRGASDAGTDAGEEYKSQKLSLGDTAKPDDAEFIESIELLDVWLPRHNLMVTLCGDDPAIPPLRVVEWQGPECGPYHVLRFRPVPGSLLPAAPAAQWEEIHEISNRLFNKIVRQAERQKNITVVGGGGDADMEAMRDTPDGEAVKVMNLDNIKPVSMGGFNAENFGFVAQLKNLFSWSAGNLDAVGGLAASSGTVGQDKLLTESASQQVREFQEGMYRFTRGAIRSIAQYLWTDPVSSYSLTRKIEGTPISIESSWPFDSETGEDKREGDFLQYNFAIEPFSLQAQSPQERVQVVLGILDRLAPFIQQMEAKGQSFDFEALLKYIANYANIPELKDMVTYTEGEQHPEAGPRGAGGQSPKMPANTSRTYNRVSRAPGAESGAMNAIIGKAMLGTEPQPKEMAAFAAGM